MQSNFLDLRLSIAECEELTENAIKRFESSTSVEAVRLALPLLIPDANGHVGLWCGALRHISRQFENQPANSAAVLSYYIDGLQTQAFADVFRPVEPLSPALFRLLRPILLHRALGVRHGRDTSSEASAMYSSLQAVGLLILATTQRWAPFSLASELHFQWAMRVAYPLRDSAWQPEPDGIDDWLVAVIGSFEQSVLWKKEYCTPAGLPTRQGLLHMFHRGASLLLNPQCALSGELSDRFENVAVVVPTLESSHADATGTAVLPH